MRDRLVVRSSVIPSAKYCWSGSLLRLANGSTTIDRRGATRGWAMEVAAATAWEVLGAVLTGQPHQTAAETKTATVAMAVAAKAARRRRAMTGTRNPETSA